MKPDELSNALNSIASMLETPARQDQSLATAGLKRILSSMNENVNIHVTEDPNMVIVTYNGIEHSANWGDDEELTNVEGDINLLHAAMVAWSGETEEFILTPEELAKMGGGWWAP